MATEVSHAEDVGQRGQEEIDVGDGEMVPACSRRWHQRKQGGGVDLRSLPVEARRPRHLEPADVATRKWLPSPASTAWASANGSSPTTRRRTFTGG